MKCDNGIIEIKTIKEPKKCKFCGNQFIPVRRDQKYCDSKCRDHKNHGYIFGKSKKIKITCYHCFEDHTYKILDVSKPPQRIAKKCNNCKKYFYLSIDENFETTIARPNIETQCDYCGNNFLPKLKRQRFCSKICRTENRIQDRKQASKDYEEKLCEICRVRFIPRTGNQICCSKKCSKRRWYQNTQIKKGVKPIEKVCKNCGTIFSSLISKKIYCSSECLKNQWYMDNRKIKNYKKITCKQCGKVFQPISKIHRFCSETCRDQKYYFDKHEEILEKAKIYRLENLERIRIYFREFYKKNRDRISERSHKKYIENKEKEFERIDKYYKQVYEVCEDGVLKDVLIYKVFDYINQHPGTSRKKVQKIFYYEHPRRLSCYYSTWVALTYRKYIEKEVF